MRVFRAFLGMLVGALVAGGCVLPPPPGTQPPPRVDVLSGDARASQYGTEASQIFEHPQLRDKVRSLFGRDWSASSAVGPSRPASEYFAKSSPPRVLRIDGSEWLAVAGCVPAACTTRRGLVLASTDGERLLARIDDGGLTHAYGFGPGMTTLTPADRAVADAARRAVE